MRGRVPAISALAAAGGLVFGENDKALRQLRGEHLQKEIVRRTGRLQDDDAPADDIVA